MPERDILRYQKMYREGHIQLRELITHRISLDEINDAIAGMRDGSIHGRVLVDMQK